VSASEAEAPAGPHVSPAGPEFGAPMPKASVMFAIPAYGGLMHDACVHGLLDAQATLAEHKIGFGYITIRNESLIQRARNFCVAKFMESDATHLLFVDADIGFRGAHVLRLLAHDRDLIGGIYRKKVLSRRDWVATYLPGDTAPRDARTGAVQVAAIGTGFMMLSRRVLERMRDAFPGTEYVIHPNDCSGATALRAHALFDCWIDPISRSYLSEDYAFCARWRALGGEVWCDPALVLEHHGTACFGGDATEDFRAG
jgi:hypothetical protein